MNAKEIIKKRVQKRIDTIPWEEFSCDECYIGGNSLNKQKPNDYDLFPVGDEEIDTGKLKILSETKNAKTVSGNNITIQICNYRHPSLEALVQSFDFAHIQIGAYLKRSLNDKMEVTEIYFTEAYEAAKISEGSSFEGSEYPLASLVRLFKYHERKNFSGKSYLIECLKILEAILERGVNSYEDFKDQLDAVDLGLVPEDFNGGTDLLIHLYELLTNEKEPTTRKNREMDL